jgi:hypothetical protein
MKRRDIIAIVAGVVALTSARAARAQDEGDEGRSFPKQPVRAPRSAFEIGFTPGYTQGFGRIAGETRRLQETTDAGFGATLALGYRATPHWHVGWTGQIQAIKADASMPSGTGVRGILTGIDATYHGIPYERIDPWVQYGAGYRMLWISPQNEPSARYSGIELARLAVGFDVRVSPDVAVGPVIGADLDLFLYESPGGSAGSITLSQKRVSSFVFAGVQGRFDLAGFREKAAPASLVGER